MRVRREEFYRQRALRRRGRDLHATIKWWAYDPAGSEHHPVYDESGGKVYRPARYLPLLWWFDEEGGDRVTGEGRTLFRALHFAIAISEFHNVGLVPEPDRRINDMVQWEGWFWEVVEFDETAVMESTHQSYRAAQLHGSTARITAFRRYPETDMPFDEFPDETWTPPIPAPDGGGAGDSQSGVFDGGDAGSF